MDIIEELKERFPEGVWEIISSEPELCLKIIPDKIKDVAVYLKQEPQLDFDYLMCLSGVDRGEKLEVVYHLFSCEHKKNLILKVEVDKKDPIVQSVEGVWKTANWHEREVYDLFGIFFSGHPDLRRILLPEDWEGFPLRKDYQPPLEYQGIDLRP